MEHGRYSELAAPHAPASAARAVIEAMVVSEVRFFRECLRELLARDTAVRIHDECATLAHTLQAAETLRPEMILLDAAFPNGTDVATRLRAAVPATQIVAIAVPETEEAILSWAEAGIAGYVPNTASLAELSQLLRRISRGEQSCSSRVAGALLRRIGAVRRAGKAAGDQGQGTVPLTARELGILRLLGAGLTNKEIARRLDIGLGTAKSHVHNILGKLHLSRRSQIAARMNPIEGAVGPPDADRLSAGDLYPSSYPSLSLDRL